MVMREAAALGTGNSPPGTTWASDAENRIQLVMRKALVFLSRTWTSGADFK